MTAKKVGEGLQWFGFILIALGPFQMLESSASDTFFIMMMGGAILGIIGGLFVGTNKTLLAGLCFALLAVIFYVYVENSFLGKLFIIPSIGLAIVGTFLEWKSGSIRQED